MDVSKIISGINKGVSLVNQALPVYKQVKPIYKNVKSFFSTINTVKKEETLNQEKVMKDFERPTSNFISKKSNNRNGSFDLDTLTFFE